MRLSPDLTSLSGLKHSFLQLPGVVADVSQPGLSPATSQLETVPTHGQSHLFLRDSPYRMAG